METIQLLREIEQMSIDNRFVLIEETLKSIRKEETKHQMEVAAEKLYLDYIIDEELTAFTALDFENFYETK